MRSLLALLALLAFCAAFACAQEQPQSGSQRQPLIFDPGVLDQVNGDRIQVWLPSADVLELGDTDGIAGFFDTIRDPWGRISEALVNALFLRYDPASNSLSEVSGKRVEPPQRDNGLFAISNMVGSSTALRALDLEDDQKYFQDLINFLRSNMGYQSGSDLWGFPFDWRTSNGLPEKVEALHRLVQQARGTAGRPVTLLAHSMGGLFILSYFTTHPEAVDELVRQVIFVGTPPSTAPRAAPAPP